MRNIVELCGSNFPRIRIGFKPTENLQIPLINLVLSGIKKEDEGLFDKVITLSANAVIDFVSGKTVQAVMQKYNGKAE